MFETEWRPQGRAPLRTSMPHPAELGAMDHLEKGGVGSDVKIKRLGGEFLLWSATDWGRA